MLKDLSETNKQLLSNIHELQCVKTDLDLKLHWEMKVTNQLELERKDYYTSWKKMKNEALSNIDKVEEYMINYQHEKQNRISIEVEFEQEVKQLKKSNKFLNVMFVKEKEMHEQYMLMF